ncbi:MAG: hypothetical protein KC619_02735 [Myxococcales bacterium]|nr:hypothetical protein [Myxococcales bacterium]
MDVPERLTARVVSPGDDPTIHGYAVADDLARHFGFAEVVFLALTGDVPDRRIGRIFERALVCAAPITIAEAPSHAAVLARLSGARPSSVAAVAAVGVAEQSRFRLEQLAPLLSWLREGREGPAPRSAPEPGTAALHDVLQEAGLVVDERDRDLSLTAALVAVFHDLGLREAWQLEAAFVVARWPLAQAEAMSNTPGALGTYPIRLPSFDLRGTPREP